LIYIRRTTPAARKTSQQVARSITLIAPYNRFMLLAQG